MSDRIKCQSCEKHRHELHSIGSKLINGMNLIMCQDCIDNKFEPRFVVVLAYLDTKVAKRRKKAEEYIALHRYYGDDITLAETLVK